MKPDSKYNIAYSTAPTNNKPKRNRNYPRDTMVRELPTKPKDFKSWNPKNDNNDPNLSDKDKETLEQQVLRSVGLRLKSPDKPWKPSRE
jgi:hypothetical protein